MKSVQELQMWKEMKDLREAGRFQSVLYDIKDDSGSLERNQVCCMFLGSQDVLEVRRCSSRSQAPGVNQD